MDDRTLVFLTVKEKLLEYFPDTRIEMEYKPDREYGLPAYWVYVFTELDPIEAGKRMDAFDENWWLENSHLYNVGVNLRFGP